MKIDRGGWSKTVIATLGQRRHALIPDGPCRWVGAGNGCSSGTAYGDARRSAPHPYYEDETPADIDDQHGYGG